MYVHLDLWPLVLPWALYCHHVYHMWSGCVLHWHITHTLKPSSAFFSLFSMFVWQVWRSPLLTALWPLFCCAESSSPSAEIWSVSLIRLLHKGACWRLLAWSTVHQHASQHAKHWGVEKKELRMMFICYHYRPGSAGAGSWHWRGGKIHNGAFHYFVSGQYV